MEDLLQKVGASKEAIVSLTSEFNISASKLLYDSNSDENSASVLHSKIDQMGPTISFAVKGSVYFVFNVFRKFAVALLLKNGVQKILGLMMSMQLFLL